MCVWCWIEDFGGMSDLCLYELEDTVWDEFGRSDDHIVPGDEYRNQFTVHGDSRKKPKHEGIGISNIDDTTNCGFQRENGNSIPPLNKKDTMLEKGSWSHTPDDVFPASCDKQVKEVTSIASDDTRGSGHGNESTNLDSVSNGFCADDPILDDKCSELDNNLYRLPLNDISQTDSDLSFLNNDCEDKESSELLYYNWPEIGNFEDVDRMFRSCDSTFGLGNLSNEDDLGWFSASHVTEGSEDPLKSSSELENVSEHCEDFKPHGKGASTNNSSRKDILIDDNKTNFQTLDGDGVTLSDMSFTNGGVKSGAKDGLSPNAQVKLHKQQPHHENQLEGKREGRHLESSSAFHQQGDLKQFVDVKHPFRNSSLHGFSSVVQQHEQNIGATSLRHVQTHIPYIHLDYSRPSDQLSASPPLSATISEKNDYPSASPKESSYASNQMERSHDPSFVAPSKTTNQRGERLYKLQELRPSSARRSTAFCDSVTAQKQVQFEHEMEDQSEVEGGSMGFPAELDSSNVQESSCVSSVLDDISLEATSFRQLQQVMEKLDPRTKLCIRDSLYRLAKSAEQRHNYANPGGSVRENRDAHGALIAGETNNGFMDMETDTNPIDRSIAHLLFHRPSDRAVMPPSDAVSFKSHVMIRDSITSPTEKAEKNACQEETAAVTDKKLMVSDSN